MTSCYSSSEMFRVVLAVLLADAAYYANWLSMVYDLKDRSLENLLVFSPKIEDLTFLTLVYLQTKGKREKWLSFTPKPLVRKDKVYRWLFLRFELQNQRWFYGFWGWLLCLTMARIMSVLWAGFLCLLQPKKRKSADIVRFGFGEAIFFLSLC